ncbi:MAG: nucleotide exchange factor GrpE [Candidatus Moranbacteria bacterium RIFOXYC12_FULL_36_13]|nr:MAG: Protein GrpE [Candidatus Moranbacteria bacterium GW2011_GWF2_35_39]OGI32924.1 MAG: nucleotide exchange factor GrpE [Candidatus Moranbacteria bacterium RIFOXYC12_FULL_36_13]
MRIALYECAHANNKFMEKIKKMEASEQKKDRARPMEITVKAVVISEDGQTLILKRVKDSDTNPDKWDIPGGLLEAGETIEKALKREIKEETGLEVEIGPVIRVSEFPKETKQFKKEKRSLRFIAYCQGNTEVKLSDEHSEFLWLEIDEAVKKLNEKDGFENDKGNTLLDAKKYLELKNSLEGWKRCMADFENYKKRQAEDRKDMIAFSNLNLISEILPILDNFHASTDHIPEDQKDGGWVVGIMHIQHQLEKVLEENGVSEILVNVGDEFAPNIMEAVKQESGDSEQETSENKVKKVLMKGYKINSKVIRVARVVVE